MDEEKYLIGDCLSLMRAMPRNKVDLTITSPPYNKGEQGAVIVKAIKYAKSSDKLNEEEYQKNQVEVLDELYAITKAGGSCFYNHRTRWEKGKPIYPFQWLQNTKWQIKQHIIWNRKICGNLRGWRFYHTYEDIFWLWKDDGQSPGMHELDTRIASLGSVWDIPPYSTKGKPHPCMFPPTIPARSILACCPPDGLVFDPYAGSGTTLLAAKVLGRDYLGIDVAETYKEVAMARLKHPLQKDLRSILNEKDRIYTKERIREQLI